MTRRRWRVGRGPAPRQAQDPSFDDELRFHLESRLADLVAAGATPEAARRQAEREFGDADDARRYIDDLHVRAHHSHERSLNMRGIGQDLRYAIRRLRYAPAFSLGVVLTFTLGIGATATIFSVVNGVLLRPLPFPNPERLYEVYTTNRTANIVQGAVSPVDLDDWRAARQHIADIGGFFYMDDTSGASLEGRGLPRRLATTYVTGGFFDALGVTPEQGRLPREEELRRGGPDHVVVLADGFWAREFGRDPHVLGATLSLAGEPYVVIGVVPSTVRLSTERPDIFLPYSTIPDSSIPRLRMVRLLSVIARAKPDVSGEQVGAEMSRITGALARTYPEDAAWGAATIVPLTTSVVAPVQDRLWVLFAAVGFVLAMACANVTGLQLARAASRASDVAVASALGAARGRLVRQLVIEGVVLAVVGGTLGVLVAMMGVSALLSLTGDQLPRAADVHVDATAMLFTLAVAVLAGFASTLVPALRATRQDSTEMLRGAGRGLMGMEHARLRSGLVVVEVAVAMVLAVGAGLMGRSFAALLHVDPGFTPDHVVAAVFTIDESRHGSGSPGAPTSGLSTTAYYREVIDRVRALPGVVSAAAVKDAPFRGVGERNGFMLPGQPVPPGQDPPLARVIHVSDGYFHTIGAHMLEGREFSPTDLADTPHVAVVNEAFAHRYFPGRRTIGQQLLVGDNKTLEIVGLVGDIRQSGLADPVQPTMYLDNMQNTRVKVTLVARTQGAPALMTTPVRDAIWSVDAEQPIADVFTFDDAFGQSLASPRLLLILLGTFGIAAVAIGVVGIYGLLASLVSRRRTEIGVRMALGASPGSVSGLFVRRGAMLAIAGIAIGTGAAFGLTRFLTSVLFEVKPSDPPTIAGMAVALFLAAILASWLPARRVAAIDPARALRSS